MEREYGMKIAQQKIMLVAIITAYCLIGIEIIIMISPFALYFYSVYGPLLNTLASSRLTSWSTEFFLPHMVFPDAPLVLAISYLQILLVVGLALFFSAAIPLYYGRFTGKGVVTKGFYARIRHPQYLFLAISGFGLLLYWPRFIILALYITMLYVYYFLAKNEEWRMKIEDPAYEEYLAKTPMFLPGNPGGKLFAFLFGWLSPKWLGILCSYLVSLSMALLLALFFRAYVVKQLPLGRQAGIVVVSVFPRSEAEIAKATAWVLADKQVQRHLQKQGVNLAYLMPGDFFLTALVTDEERRFSSDITERFPQVLEWHQYKFKGGLRNFFKIFYNFVRTLGTKETEYDIERFVFVSVRDQNNIAVAEKDLFHLGVKRRPVLLVDVDGDTHEVLKIVETSQKHKWGNMPMPVF